MGFGPHFLGWTSKDHFFLNQTWNIENRLDWEHIYTYLGPICFPFSPHFSGAEKKGVPADLVMLDAAIWLKVRPSAATWVANNNSVGLPSLGEPFSYLFVTKKYRQCPWNAFWKTSRHALLYKLVGFNIIVIVSFPWPFHLFLKSIHAMVCKSLHLLSWWRSSQVMSAAWLEYHSMSTSLLFYPFYLHKDVEILVGGLEHFVFFHIYILGMHNHPNWLINIFQRGRSTTNQDSSFAHSTMPTPSADHVPTRAVHGMNRGEQRLLYLG